MGHPFVAFVRETATEWAPNGSGGTTYDHVFLYQKITAVEILVIGQQSQIKSTLRTFCSSVLAKKLLSNLVLLFIYGLDYSYITHI